MGRELHAPPAAIQLTLTVYLIGVAVGQLVSGPISDAVGRRIPLLAGLIAYMVTTAACAAAPNSPTFVVLRFLEGAVGASGISVTRAVVRDLFAGSEMAHFLSRLMIITGFVPILAPFVGSQLLELTGWRGIFWILTAAGGVLFVAVLLWLPETLPPSLRHSGTFRDSLRTFGRLATERRFIGLTLTCALAFGVLLIYISDAPFVFEDVYGLSPRHFGFLFGINSLFLVAAGQVNGFVVRRVSLDALLRLALCVMGVGAVMLLVSSAGHVGGVLGVMVPVWLLLFGVGLATPNSTALAMTDHPEAAGTASALLGSAQFVLGASLAPLTGLFGHTSAFPMGVVIALAAAGALVAYGVVARPRQ
jgi:DHA1 family bicyclomycin/chloramphenicol resistance-like MFS transporter